MRPAADVGPGLPPSAGEPRAPWDGAAAQGWAQRTLRRSPKAPPRWLLTRFLVEEGRWKQHHPDQHRTGSPITLLFLTIHPSRCRCPKGSSATAVPQPPPPRRPAALDTLTCTEQVDAGLPGLLLDSCEADGVAPGCIFDHCI